MDLVAVQHRVINRLGKVTEHRLFRGIVGNLHHDPFVLPDLVPDSMGIVNQIFFGEVVGDKQLIQSANYLGDKLFIYIFWF